MIDKNDFRNNNENIKNNTNTDNNINFNQNSNYYQYYNKVRKDDERLNEVKSKEYIKGYIVGAVTIVIIYLIFNISSLVSPLPNSRGIIKKLNQMHNIITKYNIYDMDENYIEDMICFGMMAGLKDKYATYYTKEDVKKLTEDIAGEYVGIGVIVLESPDNPYLVVTKVYDTSPAKTADIKIGDEIRMVDDKELSGLSSDEVVALVRGREGTEVNVTVYRPETDEMLTKTITRKKIDTPMITTNYKEGVLHIIVESFEGKAYEQILEAKEKYDAKDLKGLIIDFRNCPGGNLNVLINLADLFLDEAIITYFEDKDGMRKYYVSQDGKWDVPMAVLVNEYTASAAEAFTGAMQDNNRAKVFGTTTYGKGVVQEIFSLSDGTAIKFTISKYYTPNGNEVNEKGIVPDVEVKNTNENIDEQYNKAHEYILNIPAKN